MSLHSCLDIQTLCLKFQTYLTSFLKNIYTSLYTVSGSKYIKKHEKKTQKQTIYKMTNQTSQTPRHRKLHINLSHRITVICFGATFYWDTVY